MGKLKKFYTDHKKVFNKVFGAFVLGVTAVTSFVAGEDYLTYKLIKNCDDGNDGMICEDRKTHLIYHINAECVGD